jgi:halocyanin-like protein
MRGLHRRRLLRAAGALAAAATAGCLGGSDAGSGPGSGSGSGDAASGSGSNGGEEVRSFGGYLRDVSNYDGVVDRTGRSSVEVTVGAEANGGAFGFAPAAIRVSTDTEVVWTWTGEGGSHNVVAEDGSFRSALTVRSGHRFRHTFDESGTFRYVCTPHRSLGMKGVVVVA